MEGTSGEIISRDWRQLGHRYTLFLYAFGLNLAFALFKYQR